MAEYQTVDSSVQFYEIWLLIETLEDLHDERSMARFNIMVSIQLLHAKS